jgi:glycosyltransferase involved in cell wall biosynthesis
MGKDSYDYSIILPVRNGGEYVKGCITSILSQTYKSFNLHVLDNYSTDGTLELLRSVQDDRIIIYEANRPLSMEENWARILSIKKNQFITIIGHDDILDKNFLQVMHDLIQKNPGASLYQSHFRFINSMGNVIRKCKPMPVKQNVQEFLQSILTDSLDTMGTGYMMRAFDYEHIGGIKGYPNLLFADHELWLRLTAISYKVTSLDEVFSFRIHQSVSRKSSAIKYVHSFNMFMDFLVNFKLKHTEVNKIIEDYISEYMLYYCRSLSHRLLRTPMKDRENMTVSKFIQQCQKYALAFNVGKRFMPNKKFNIWIARMIDSNFLTHSLYLLFRKVYKKPIYS